MPVLAPRIWTLQGGVCDRLLPPGTRAGPSASAVPGFQISALEAPRSPTRGMDEGDGLLVNGELAEVLKLVHSVRTGLSDSTLQIHFVAVGFRNLVTVPPTTPSTARRWVLL